MEPGTRRSAGRDPVETDGEVPSGRCVIGAALGRPMACAGAACPFHHVPGIEGCAVRAWAPEVAADPDLASWFMSRRLEAATAARVADRARLARHARLVRRVAAERGRPRI